MAAGEAKPPVRFHEPVDQGALAHATGTHDHESRGAHSLLPRRRALGRRHRLPGGNALFGAHGAGGAQAGNVKRMRQVLGGLLPRPATRVPSPCRNSPPKHSRGVADGRNKIQTRQDRARVGGRLRSGAVAAAPFARVSRGSLVTLLCCKHVFLCVYQLQHHAGRKS